MSSARSRLLTFFTRLAMWLVFRGTRPLAYYRDKLAALDAKQTVKVPQTITVEDVTVPLPGRWLHHTTPRSQQVLLYLHGGAFVMRLPNGHTSMVARLVADAGCSAFMPWYRLAPEHPFPAAVEDALSAYRSLLDAGHAPRDIVIMGDSAGGNLCLAVLHLIARERLPMPAASIALSPITDFAQISATWRMNHWRDPMYRVQAYVNPVEHYLQNRSDAIDPRMSPYYGDLRGFPPLYFLVGGLEALLDDSIGMARKAIEAGVPARVQIWHDMPHVFMLQELLPEAREARREVCTWLTELRESAPRAQPLYRGSVEFCTLRAFSGRVERENNNVFLDVGDPAASQLSTV